MWAKFFGKKGKETVEILNNQFDSLRKNTQATFIALVGLKGNIKGQPIISTIDDNCEFDKTQIKRFQVKLTEMYFRFKVLDLIPSSIDQQLQSIQFDYGSKLQFSIVTVPEQKSETFLVVALTTNIPKLLKGIEKIAKTINLLTYRSE